MALTRKGHEANAMEGVMSKKSKKSIAAAPVVESNPVVETAPVAPEPVVDNLDPTSVVEGFASKPEEAPADIELVNELHPSDVPTTPEPTPEPEVTLTPAEAQAVESAKVPAFKLFDSVPDGGPGSDGKPAIPVAVSEENIGTFLLAARDIILTATGPKDGLISPINRRAFHTGIRVYLPESKFPGQAISLMDEEMYACRVAHRIINAVRGKRVKLSGGYGSRKGTIERAHALWDALSTVAAETKVNLLDGATLAPEPPAADSPAEVIAAAE